ncbi:pyridoxal-dependent decarboxylase, exosortase A system-associated [Microlunatus parietis]|uniref:Diaminopimelate decarboxylase n=1 Tax=Microlunatus parietis TaxID=682979 RepID=A0A7Y9LDM7_9ACTN|nr:pyridoxal-dependent decarboxylase, exosortase A system-associated [Microlunatus parietis]NYE73033.1 diaminopimelate decarboxylase [Microlunatus parietis]
MTASELIIGSGPADFGTVAGELAIGGIGLSRLAARIGSTPFFAYDRSLITERVQLLRQTLPPAIRLHYAVKANPMPAVVQHLAGLVDGLDVASAGELAVALDTGIRPDRIGFAGPGKAPAEIGRAVAAGITLELESETEARRVAEAGVRLGIRPRVAIRVNPDFAVRGSGMRMGGGPQQFGVDAERVPDLLRLITALDLDLIGFHVFAGSQNLNADILGEAQRRTVELIIALAELSSTPVRYLNLGGGFGIPYSERDRPLDLTRVAANLAELIDGPIANRLPEARPVLELGRYLVGESGVYVTRVLDRKLSRGEQFLVVDGGMHHQLAASGNLGQVIRRNYPVAVGNKITEPPAEVSTVVGRLCTPLDLLADKVVLPTTAVDDLIVIFQAGAYGLTASPTAFLGHPAPAEALI